MRMGNRDNSIFQFGNEMVIWKDSGQELYG